MPTEYHSIGLKQMLLYQAGKTCSPNTITQYKKYTNYPSVIISTPVLYFRVYILKSWPEDKIWFSHFAWFSSDLPWKCRDITFEQATSTSTLLQIHQLQSSYYLTSYNTCSWKCIIK